MDQEQARSVKQKKKTNGWKWAFLSLVGLIIIAILFLFRALAPVKMEVKTTETPIEVIEEMSLVSSLTTEDAELIMNTSIDTLAMDENMLFNITLDDQLVIDSAFKLFNFQVPYTLFFDPFVTENGNLQLRADAIELANYSMPVSAVLSLLAGQVEWPFYIGIDSETQIILIDFNELSKHYDVDIAMEKIDLENNEIQLKLTWNKDTLIQALSLQEISQLEVEE